MTSSTRNRVFLKRDGFLSPFSFPLKHKRYFRGIKTVPRVAFLKKSAYRFRVNGRNGGFQKTMTPYIVFPLFWVFSCGRAKTIRIRQRILRKYSEVRKNTHYCVIHGKALEFLSISLRDTVAIMHTPEGCFIFFFLNKTCHEFLARSAAWRS